MSNGESDVGTPDISASTWFAVMFVAIQSNNPVGQNCLSEIKELATGTFLRSFGNKCPRNMGHNPT